MKIKQIKYTCFVSGINCLICLLGGILLFCSCGSDDNNGNDGNNSDDGNTITQFLQLSQYGLNKIDVLSDEENCTYSFMVERQGKKVSSQITARLIPWEEKDLSRYNMEEKSSYTLLPAALYSVTSTNITLESGMASIKVEIKFNPSKVFIEFKKTGAEYIIPIRLESDNAKIVSAQRDLILKVSLNYPKVEFETFDVTSVSVNKEITSVDIFSIFHYKVNNNMIGSQWDFSCDLIIPENADELVKSYNKFSNTDYELLPRQNFDLKEKIQFKVGDTKAKGIFSIIKKEEQGMKKYLLPLALTDISNEGIVCSKEVRYIVISRLYTNPIISESAPDPTVIRTNDGYFYLYATEDTRGMAIYRSEDLLNWEKTGTVFNKNNRPTWQGGGSLWAPEIRYIKNQYVLYYSWAKWGDIDNCHIGVATASSPEGPFKDQGCLINAGEMGVRNSIDPFLYEEDGINYMFWGSFQGIYVTMLEDDGLSVKRSNDGKPLLLNQICGKKFEATCIYKRGDYYYLFASVGSCCAGPESTYRVVVGRSKKLLGPYVDQNGGEMLNNQYREVVKGNSKWAGPGHNSIIIKDDAGTEWMIYHGRWKANDAGRFVLLDRLLWTDDDWPYVKGLAPSEEDLIPIIE